MRFGLSDDVIEQINGVFKKYSVISKVILYGSRAKGNYRTGSDIDLTIVSDKSDYKLLTELMVELDDLLLPYMIDLSFYNEIDNQNLKEHIDRVGILFYER